MLVCNYVSARDSELLCNSAESEFAIYFCALMQIYCGCSWDSSFVFAKVVSSANNEKLELWELACIIRNMLKLLG